jgi:hypothetical protein
MLHADKVLVADYRKDVGTTTAFDTSSFSCDPLGFTGRNGVSASDTNANGKYDVLKIEAGVYAARADFYEWSGTLLDANGVEIDFSAGSGFLPAGNGTVAFTFDGHKMGRNGVNGPYMLRSVLLFGAGQSVIVDEHLQPQDDGADDGHIRACLQGRERLLHLRCRIPGEVRPRAMTAVIGRGLCRGCRTRLARPRSIRRPSAPSPAD